MSAAAAATAAVVGGTASRARALALYRAIWRASRTMPTVNRKLWVRKKLRDEFVAARAETDPAKLELAFAYGEVSLDNVKAQAQHLTQAALFAPWG